MGSDGRDAYAWLAVWAVLCHRIGGDDPPGLEMARIDAVAGQFRQPASNAANDQQAALLILVLIWWLACAKYRAISSGFGSGTCKLTGRSFLPVILREPACLRLFPVSALLLALCQNDHLPTPPTHQVQRCCHWPAFLRPHQPGILREAERQHGRHGHRHRRRHGARRVRAGRHRGHRPISLPAMKPEDLELLVTREMPFGKSHNHAGDVSQVRFGQQHFNRIECLC